MTELYEKNAVIDLFNPGCETSKLLSLLQERDDCEAHWFTLTYKGIEIEKIKTTYGGFSEYASQKWVFVIDPMLMRGWGWIGPGDNEISYSQGTGWTTPPTLTALFEALKSDASFAEEFEEMTMEDLGWECKTIEQIRELVSTLNKAKVITENWGKLRNVLLGRRLKPLAWKSEMARILKKEAL